MLRTSGFAFERWAKDPSLLLKRVRTHSITISPLSPISREIRETRESVMTSTQCVCVVFVSQEAS